MYNRSKISNNMQASEKNLHASLSPLLLTRMHEAAADEKLTLDEFVSDAIERRLNRRALDEMLAFGKRHARERGLRPNDVAGAIAETRASEKAHGR